MVRGHMKLLVIGNHCLSQSESNGRVLRSLLSAFSDEELTSFAIRGIPDCLGIRYVTVTDGDAVNAVTHLSFYHPVGIQANEGNGTQATGRKRSAKTHLIRNLIWSTKWWLKGSIKQALYDKGYDAIFLMGADTPFLYRLAVDISKKKKTPLIVYTAEDYPIKRYDYIEQKPGMSFWCKRFLNKLRKAGKLAFESASVCILNSPKLKASYESAYSLERSEVVYLPSSFEALPQSDAPKTAIIYAGNINIHRLNSLIQIGNTIHSIDSSKKLILYGRLSDEESEKLTSETESLDYRGILPYEVLLKVYGQAALLIHAEGFDDFYLLDCAHAFSTKVADCLCSGVPFFLYAPIELPSSAFMNEALPDFYARNEEELREKLSAILSGEVTYQPNAEYIHSCFDRESVGKRIRQLIEEVSK